MKLKRWLLKTTASYGNKFGQILCNQEIHHRHEFILAVPEIASFTKYFTLNKDYTEECGIKQLCHGLSTYTIHKPPAKSRELSPPTGGQTMEKTIK